jgi:hypothetical protein
MATLNGKKVSESYKDLLQVSNSNSGVDATLRTVEDGEGTSAGVQLSTTDTSFNGNYILKEEGRQNHVANTMPAPSMYFNSDTYGFIDHNDKYDAGANDFSIEVRFKLQSGKQLFISHINSWLSNGWVLRAFDGGSGSNVWRVRLNDGSSTLDYMPNATWEFDKWVHAVFTFDRSGNLTIYQDGVSVGTTSITSYSGAGVSSSAGKLGINTYTGSTAYSSNIDISNIRWHNRLLSADEVKHYYSGGSVPFEYQGADNTHRVTANAIAGTGLGSVSSATATGFDLLGSGWGRGGFALSSNLEKGKKYRITYTLSSASFGGESTSGYWSARAVTSASMSDSGSQSLVDNASHNAGTLTADFIASASNYSHITIKASAQNINVRVTNFDIREIGCVVDLDPSGVASDKWLDKSGNDLHANMTNGAVHNAPTSDDGLVYEEGTWSPVICQADDTDDVLPMHAETAGKYVRIGNTVTVTGQAIGNNSAGDMTASDSIAIKGLPYPVPNAYGNRSTATCLGLTVNLASGKRVGGYVVQNSSQINLYVNDGTSEGALRYDEFTQTGHIIFQATYIV